VKDFCIKSQGVTLIKVLLARGRIQHTEICMKVTAPVRETAAQALGAVARALTTGQTKSVLRHLGQLTRSQEWCVRHGGFLGLKYLLAARQECLEELLPTVLPLAIAGLQVIWPLCTFEPKLLTAVILPSQLPNCTMRHMIASQRSLPNPSAALLLGFDVPICSSSDGLISSHSSQCWPGNGRCISHTGCRR